MKNGGINLDGSQTGENNTTVESDATERSTYSVNKASHLPQTNKISFKQ